jgi:Ca-activated chloride channel family protein
LLGVIFLGFYFYNQFKKKKGVMKFPGTKYLPPQGKELRVKIYKFLPYLQGGAFFVLLLGLARPQLGKSYEEITTYGVDIMLVMDISSSMKTIDFHPDYTLAEIQNLVRQNKIPPPRITLAKREALKFVEGREGDRIGLVLFSKHALTQCPLTLDYRLIKHFLTTAKIGLIEDGTAIGMGIATAIMRLKKSPGKSKVIILLTDGRNNAGKIEPLTAAEIAKDEEIKIYSIGVGNKEGVSIYEVEDPFFGRKYVQVEGQELNEEELKKLAQITGGIYFRSDTPGTLEKIFKTIDKLEKVKIKKKRYTLYKEIFHYFLLGGLVLLTSYLILTFLIVPKFP